MTGLIGIVRQCNDGNFDATTTTTQVSHSHHIKVAILSFPLIIIQEGEFYLVNGYVKIQPPALSGLLEEIQSSSKSAFRQFTK